MTQKGWITGVLLVLFMLVCPGQGMAQEVCGHVELDVCRAVGQLMKQKEEAVKRQNLDRYLQTIDPKNAFYKQEQKRWFQDAVQVMDPGSYHVKVLSVAPEDKKTVCALVEQTYTTKGQKVSVKVPLRFRNTSGGWKEADLFFKRLGDQRITVYYTEPSLKMNAQIAYHTLKKAASKLRKRLDWHPGKIEVKLYHNPDWFRHSVKPSLPVWAGGWHEANQSIKMVANGGDPQQLAAGMIHELTHQAVSELTNDNAAYWLQEGAAMYYEAHLMPELHVNHHLERLKRKWPLEVLERTSLEKLPSSKAHQYYLNSYIWYKHLIEQYGEKEVKQLFLNMRKFSYIDMESEPKRAKLNQRTRDALSKTFCAGEKNIKKSVDLCR